LTRISRSTPVDSKWNPSNESLWTLKRTTTQLEFEPNKQPLSLTFHRRKKIILAPPILWDSPYLTAKGVPFNEPEGIKLIEKASQLDCKETDSLLAKIPADKRSK
jgi:hypothetical protein